MVCQMTKQINMSGIECDYSFDMLYRAAFGRNIPLKEKRALQSATQVIINKKVLEWALIAGWITDERKGNDKNLYIAFYPPQS